MRHCFRYLVHLLALANRYFLPQIAGMKTFVHLVQSDPHRLPLYSSGASLRSRKASHCPRLSNKPRGLLPRNPTSLI
jgi:hypothetical protein